MTYFRLILAFLKNTKLALFLQFLTLVITTLLLCVYFSMPQILRVQSGVGANWAPDLALVINSEQNSAVTKLLEKHLANQPVEQQLSGRLVHLPHQTFILGKNMSFPITLNFREVLEPQIKLSLKRFDGTSIICNLVSLKGSRFDWQLKVDNCPLQASASSIEKITLDQITPELLQLDKDVWQLTFLEEDFTSSQRRLFYQRLLQGLDSSLPLKHSGIGFDLGAATVSATEESTDLLIWQKALEASYAIAYPSAFSQQVLLDRNTSTDLNGRFNDFLSLRWLNLNGRTSDIKPWVSRPLLEVNASTVKQPQFWAGYSWAGSQALDKLLTEIQNNQINGQLYYYQHLWWPNAKIPNPLLDEVKNLPGVTYWTKAELDQRPGFTKNSSWSLLPSGITYLFSLFILVAGVGIFHQRNAEAIGFLRLQGQSIGIYTPLFLVVLLAAFVVSYFIWSSWNVFFQEQLRWFHHPVYSLPLTAYLMAAGLTLLLLVPVVFIDQLLLNKSTKHAISGVNDHG